MSVNNSSQGPEVNKNKSLYHVIVGDWEHKLRTNLNITQTLAEIKIFNHLEQQRTKFFLPFRNLGISPQIICAVVYTP
jgi:hypothetical protein